MVLLSLGCSEADKRKWKHQTAEQNFSTALESENADLRREAVVRIGESGYWAGESAFKVLDAVARTDPVPQVRCIAIRILGRYNDARPVQPLLDILAAGEKNGNALPGNDDVRWEAATALLAMQRQRLLTDEQQNTACDLYVQFLRTDRSRNVRIVSTQALGEFQDKRVLTPLINCLREADFMIADSAERSLIALTGVTHEYDADAWTRWVDQTPDPFAHAGEEVATSRPSGPSWWDKQQRVWRKSLKLGND